MQKHGLPPLIWADSEVLILGSLPGDESIRLGHYYADAKNQFWKILSAVYEDSVPEEYEGRIDFLRRHKLAVWDVLHSAERDGSKDANLKNERPNVQLPRVLVEYPRVTAIALNGSRARKSFRVHFGRSLPRPILLVPLPSTSAIPGKHVGSIDEKVAKWRAIRSG